MPEGWTFTLWPVLPSRKPWTTPPPLVIAQEAEGEAAVQANSESAIDSVTMLPGSGRAGDAVAAASTLPDAEMWPAFCTAAATSSMPAPQVAVVQ